MCVASHTRHWLALKYLPNPHERQLVDALLLQVRQDESQLWQADPSQY